MPDTSAQALTAFQDALTEALRGDAAALAPWWTEADAGRAGLAVYRNTVAKGLSDVILAAFPSVARVVGEDWLAAAAGRFCAAHPPGQPSLIAYGAEFPDWLAGFVPAEDMPYLAGLARLDRAWTLAHLAEDAVPLGASAFQGLGPEGFAATAVVLHPSLSVHAFDDGLAGLWLALREAGPEAAGLELDDRPSRIAVLRPGLEVETRLIGPAVFAFLTACRQGQTLAAAAEAGLAAEPGCDFSILFADLIAAGAFVRLER